MLKQKRKNCIECGKPIPEHRKIAFKKREVLTCSKKCSVHRSLTPSKNRRNGNVKTN